MGFWDNNRFCRTFGTNFPIIQAGMAGGVTSPAMVAAVSEAGGLGTLGGAAMSPDGLREAIREIKKLTAKPFGVNLLVYRAPERPVSVTPAFAEWVNEMRAEVGLGPWDGKIPDYEDRLDSCFEVILDEHVPIFSVAFSPFGKYAKAAKEAGMKLIGMATTPEEARLLADEDADAIVAQGGGAGGHRGTFAVRPGTDGESVRLEPLVSQLCKELPELPIIAAGGIMDGRGLAAAIALGADGAQLGTRFLASRESLVPQVYKDSLLKADKAATSLTWAFSGRPARGVTNRLMRTFAERGLTPLPYPLQNLLTGEIRSAAAARSSADHLSLWAGQGAWELAQLSESAGDIVRSIAREAERLLRE